MVSEFRGSGTVSDLRVADGPSRSKEAIAEPVTKA
jgi:hypothetical protein